MGRRGRRGFLTIRLELFQHGLIRGPHGHKLWNFTILPAFGACTGKSVTFSIAGQNLWPFGVDFFCPRFDGFTLFGLRR